MVVYSNKHGNANRQSPMFPGLTRHGTTGYLTIKTKDKYGNIIEKTQKQTFQYNSYAQAVKCGSKAWAPKTYNATKPLSVIKPFKKRTTFCVTRRKHIPLKLDVRIKTRHGQTITRNVLISTSNKKTLKVLPVKHCQKNFTLQNRFNILNQHEDLPNHKHYTYANNSESKKNNETQHESWKHETYKPKNDKLTLCFWNGQSIDQKTQIIKDFRLENDIDIYLLAETWLSESNHTKAITELKDNTCNFINYPRPFNQLGGGLGCIYKKQLSVVRNIPPITFTSMQVLELTLTIFSKKYVLVVIYRSESSAKHKYSMSTFFKEFSELMAHYNTMKHEVIITGDFNIHMNKPNNPHTRKLNTILNTFNLKQHINEATHKHGNTIDLLITRQKTVMKEFAVTCQLSDHNNILFKLNLKKPPPTRKKIANRKLKHIDKEKFKKDIAEKLAFTASEDATPLYLNNLVETFNSSIKVLDKHAPVTSRIVTVRDPTPWTTNEIKPEKQKRRKLEKKWKKTRLQIDYDNFKEQKNKLNTFLTTKKNHQMTKIINENKGDSRTLFKIVKQSIHGTIENPFPKGKSDKVLAEDFSKYFAEKIEKIRADLDENTNDMHYQEEHIFQGQSLSEFRPMSQEEVMKLIQESKSKSCELDPIPSDLLKYCINEVLPIITEIINTSLTLGIMPDVLKHAVVKPLLKKLDLELMNKNYRPVSNLSFLSKLIEAAVIKQYTAHLFRNGINDVHQSAYKKYHSTETLLTKVKNDILTKMDNGQVVMLVLLDLSAAFDTIDHNILLNRLEKYYGIKGNALKWFRSYLTGRTQSVSVNGNDSTKQSVRYGVPQGSKLGPILFNAYIAPLSELVRNHGIEDEKFADDEELIMAFSTNSNEEQIAAQHRMTACIHDIRDFLKRNKLCNNSDKTELLIIGTRQQLKKLNIDSIQVGDVTVQKVAHARNLGVIIDENLTMSRHVNQICKIGYYHLKNISAIRKNLDKKDTEKIIHAFISSTLDYGNALLYGTSQKNLNKLQVLQNSAARLIEKLRKHDHITETLIKLHWLPVKARIDFKILLLTWKALHGLSPPYIANLLDPREEFRALRNPINSYLKVPKSNRVTLGGNSFSIVAPTLWNQLPQNIRTAQTETTFRTLLKTYLFKKYYEL